MFKNICGNFKNRIYINACNRMSINMLLIVTLLIIILILNNSSIITLLSLIGVIIILSYNVYIGVIVEKERSSFEKTIVEKELQYSKLIEHIPIGVYRSSIKEEGRILMGNGALKELFGYSLDTNPLVTIINASDIYVNKEQRMRFISELIANKGVLSGFEAEMIKKDGTKFWGSLTARLANNGPDGYIDGTIEDISKRKQIELVLKESNSKLKELDEKKDEFIGIASHELRTPLTSLRGYLSMISDGYFGVVSNELKNTVDLMFDDCSRLINLVNDMLDISKLESGKMEFRNELFELNIFLKKIIVELSNIGKAKNITIKEDFVSDVSVCTDKNLFKQVMVNLISNAIKFTPTGGNVTIKTLKFDKKIRIHVIDDGIGIKKEDYQKIFEKFGQLNNILNEKQKGTGLGLSISKNILNQIGSHLNLTSEVGEGSDFYFELDTNVDVVK